MCRRKIPARPLWPASSQERPLAAHLFDHLVGARRARAASAAQSPTPTRDEPGNDGRGLEFHRTGRPSQTPSWREGARSSTRKSFFYGREIHRVAAYPQGLDKTELVWTCFGFATDDADMTERRLRQANLIGPAGYISMEDGAAPGFVQRAVSTAADLLSVVEMGERATGGNAPLVP